MRKSSIYKVGLRNMRMRVNSSIGELGLLAVEIVLIALLPGIAIGQNRNTDRSGLAQMALPAAGAFANWLKEQRNSEVGFADAQAMSRGVELAEARARELRA